MDNSGDSFATVLILGIDFYNATIDERNFHTLRSGGANEGRPGVLIIDGTRVDDVRIYEDGIVPTVISRYGTGGGNVPMVFEPKSAFEENWAESTVKNALRANASKSSHAIMFSHTQGLDAQPSEENSPTLRTQGGGMAVAYSIREDAQANTFSATELEVANALQAHQPSVQSHHAQTFIAEAEMQVRRLTPVECERLQGFPDGWTDGQADSNRYKQMGNAVAVPVVEWIIKRMVEAIEQ